MLTKTIVYTDFDGNEKKETHHFNLTKAEIAEYNAFYADRGGVLQYLSRLVEDEKEYDLIMAFKELILRSYGERTPTGRFIKSQEIRDSFMATEAYSELFMEITSSQEKASAFINGLFAGIPEANNQLANNVTPMPAPVG